MLGTHLMDVAAGTALLDAVGTLVLVGGGVATAVVGSAVVGVAVAVGRIRRNPTITTASLRMRSLTESGPRREIARLRLQLHKSIDGGRTLLGAADARRGLPGETPALFRRIEREAATVDQRLRLLQTEDDQAVVRAALPNLRQRVSELTTHVSRLRAAVAEGLEAASDGSMSDLGADIDREVLALKAGRERLRNLGEPPALPRPTGEGTTR